MDREFLEGLGADSGLTPEAMDAILQQHGKEISRLRLEGTLKNAVLRFGGRNEKAIAALLDLQAIGESEDMPGAMEAAMGQLKKEHGYLFEAPAVQPYAPGTGTAQSIPAATPTLAGALRQRMTAR